MGKTKEMGWNSSTNVKTTNSKTASSAQPKPNPGRGWNPAPTEVFLIRKGDPRGGSPFDILSRFS